MKNLFALISMALIVGCGKSADYKSETPKSKLLDTEIVFSATNETVRLESSYYGETGYNMFQYHNYNGGYCGAFGQWYDQNPGLNQGKICIKVFYTQCAYSYVGLIVSYKYIIINAPSGLHVTVIESKDNDDSCYFNN